jgi:hypothetical protein
MFAGSCIGVIFLVLSLEFLRRLGKEYDRFLARQYRQPSASQARNPNASEEPLNGCIDEADPEHNQRDHTGIVTMSYSEYHRAPETADAYNQLSPGATIPSSDQAGRTPNSNL